LNTYVTTPLLGGGGQKEAWVGPYVSEGCDTLNSNKDAHAIALGVLPYFSSSFEGRSFGERGIKQTPICWVRNLSISY